MKLVIHISTVHPRFDTRIFQKECCSLVEQGYRVTLIVADGLGDLHHRGVEIVDAGIPPMGRLGRMVMGVWRAMRLALKRKPWLVHLHDPELLVAAMVFRVFGVAVIYDMHENVPKQILTKRWLPGLARKPASLMVKWIERLMLESVPVVMAEESYVRDYPWVRQSVVVQNFPELGYFEGCAEKKFDTFTVGYIGGVTRERGVLAVLSAVAALRVEGRSVNFECLGPVSSEVAADSLFKSACAEGWLHAPGRVVATEGWKTIARCHVGVAVLAPLPNYTGSWPTKMFEYMAMGLPVVVSDFPMYRAALEDIGCGILVQPDEVEQIALALQQIMDHPDEACAMGERGRGAVTGKYSWPNELENLLGLYKVVRPER